MTYHYTEVLIVMTMTDSCQWEMIPTQNTLQKEHIVVQTIKNFTK